MSEKVYLYPIWVRIWHWLNALTFIVLIVTGISMQYVGMKNIFMPFGIAVSMHNVTGIILLLGIFYYYIGNRVTGNHNYYSCKVELGFNDLKKQFLFYLFGIFKKAPTPYPINAKRKFNPLQKFAYIFAMYVLMPIMIISGLGLLYPEILDFRLLNMSGIHITSLVHITAGFTLSVFMLIHIYFCTLGKTPWSNFKGMIDGWH